MEPVYTLTLTDGSGKVLRTFVLVAEGTPESPVWDFTYPLDPIDAEEIVTDINLHIVTGTPAREDVEREAEAVGRHTDEEEDE